MTDTAIARDRTKTEHLGIVRAVKHNREGEDYCILELTDDHSVHVQVDASEFLIGTMYRFLGRWKTHPRYGDQFHASSYTIHSFAGRIGVVAYLTKTCDGIGERLASRLFDKFGPETIKILREDPMRAVEEKIISADVANEASIQLQASKHLEATRIDLFEIFKGRGFHGRVQQQVIAKYGAKAPTVIRRDPFKLLGMAGAGFKRCDRLWCDLGLPLHRLKRQLYSVMQSIRDERQGHTWIDAASVAYMIKETIGGLANPVKALRLGIRARMLAVRKDAAGEVWVTLAGRAEAERRIADGIKRLCGGVEG